MVQHRHTDHTRARATITSDSDSDSDTRTGARKRIQAWQDVYARRFLRSTVHLRHPGLQLCTPASSLCRVYTHAISHIPVSHSTPAAV